MIQDSRASLPRQASVKVPHGRGPSARPQTSHFLTFVAVLDRGTGPRGLEMAAACQGVDSQDLATIMDPRRAIFTDFETDRLFET